MAFSVGMGLGVYEAVLDASQHLIVYGFSFALTGLPLARGLDRVLELLQTRGGSK